MSAYDSYNVYYVKSTYTTESYAYLTFRQQMRMNRSKSFSFGWRYVDHTLVGIPEAICQANANIYSDVGLLRPAARSFSLCAPRCGSKLLSRARDVRWLCGLGNRNLCIIQLHLNCALLCGLVFRVFSELLGEALFWYTGLFCEVAQECAVGDLLDEVLRIEWSD